MRPAQRRAALAAVLLVAACAADGSSAPSAAGDPLPGTAWLAEDIEGGGVLDRLRTTLSFLGDGRVSGNGGCNRFNGPVEVKGQSIHFGSLAVTMMACSPAVMNQEERFFAALKAATQWQRTPQHKLMLSDAAGKPVLVMSLLPLDRG
ncbi:MAG: META domain-containing protein [Rhodospirillales bacterium]